jgi:hypothetical protein
VLELFGAATARRALDLVAPLIEELIEKGAFAAATFTW